MNPIVKVQTNFKGDFPPEVVGLILKNMLSKVLGAEVPVELVFDGSDQLSFVAHVGPKLLANVQPAVAVSLNEWQQAHYALELELNKRFDSQLCGMKATDGNTLCPLCEYSLAMRTKLGLVATPTEAHKEVVPSS